jgi:hypothetical protein
MLRDVPADIQQIIQSLLLHHMQVTGPTGGDGKVVYHVNGHALTEGELRSLSQKQLLTSWDVLNYAKLRWAKRAG